MKKILPALFIFFALSFSNAYAYKDSDKSSLDLPLGKEWQITKSQQQGDYATVTVYAKNIKSQNKEELFQTTLKKTFADEDASKAVKNLQTTSVKLMKENGCKYDMLKHLPKEKTFTHEWGMFWQCPKIHTSGFLLFLIGDKDTMYNFTYRANGFYPLEKTKREEMENLIKSIQVCYQNNKCENLL